MMKPLLVFVAMPLLLTGCGLGSSAPARYVLAPAEVQEVACKKGATLKINQPNPGPALESRRIVVMDRPNHLTFYKGVAWTESNARIVQDYLVDRVEQSGQFVNVSTDMDTVPAEYRLETDLRSFNVNLTQGQQVEVRLTAAVIREADGRLLKTIKLREVADASGRDMYGVVEVFNQTMDKVGARLQTQMHRAIPGCR